MSALSSLVGNSELLAVTETLAASICINDVQCIKPKWLKRMSPEKVNHATYYLQRNHHPPLYQYCCNIIGSALQSKLDKLEAEIIQVV